MSRLTDAQKGELRFRAERGDGLCFNEHTIHQNDAHTKVWLTCGDARIGGEYIIDKLDLNQPQGIRYFVATTVASHERAVAAEIVQALFDEYKPPNPQGVVGGEPAPSWQESLAAGLETLRRSHLVVDDCWYSCPMALGEDGDSECCNDQADGRCWCGAEAHNARLDTLLEQVRAL